MAIYIYMASFAENKIYLHVLIDFSYKYFSVAATSFTLCFRMKYEMLDGGLLFGSHTVASLMPNINNFRK